MFGLFIGGAKYCSKCSSKFDWWAATSAALVLVGRSFSCFSLVGRNFERKHVEVGPLEAKRAQALNLIGGPLLMLRLLIGQCYGVTPC